MAKDAALLNDQFERVGKQVRFVTYMMKARGIYNAEVLTLLKWWCQVTGPMKVEGFQTEEPRR